MALSDEEQQMLNLIAERMYQDDPKWATSLASETNSSIDRKRAGLAVLILLIGFLSLISAAPTQLLILGPIGFLIALTGGVMLYKYLPRPTRR
jgi:hypothetical protein